MIHDRGTKKWTSLMLPEHVEMLRVLWEEMDQVDQPELDEQAYEEIEQVIHAAVYFNTTIALTYYQSGYIHVVTGEVVRINKQKKSLTVAETEVLFSNIIKVQ